MIKKEVCGINDFYNKILLNGIIIEAILIVKLDAIEAKIIL